MVLDLSVLLTCPKMKKGLVKCVGQEVPEEQITQLKAAFPGAQCEYPPHTPQYTLTATHIRYPTCFFQPSIQYIHHHQKALNLIPLIVKDRD